MRRLQLRLLRLGVILRLPAGVGGVVVLAMPVAVTRGVPVQVLDRDGLRTLVLQVVVVAHRDRLAEEVAGRYQHREEVHTALKEEVAASELQVQQVVRYTGWVPDPEHQHLR